MSSRAQAILVLALAALRRRRSAGAAALRPRAWHADRRPSGPAGRARRRRVVLFALAAWRWPRLSPRPSASLGAALGCARRRRPPARRQDVAGNAGCGLLGCSRSRLARRRARRRGPRPHCRRGTTAAALPRSRHAAAVRRLPALSLGSRRCAVSACRRCCCRRRAPSRGASLHRCRRSASDFVQTFVRSRDARLGSSAAARASSSPSLADRVRLSCSAGCCRSAISSRAADRRHRADHGHVVRLRLAVEGGGGRGDDLLPDAGEHARRASPAPAASSAT